jgi:hypothetical protein
MLDPHTIILTGNNNTVYNWLWIDVSKGPLVVEVPPGVLGAINGMWQNWVTDIGITGPDKGKGGKYLFLPPGYKGDVPRAILWCTCPPTACGRHGVDFW